MWSSLPVKSLLDLQRVAALERIDELIPVEWAGGYGREVDLLLERRYRIVEQMTRGQT